jgi:hypothetical protein
MAACATAIVGGTVIVISAMRITARGVSIIAAAGMPTENRTTRATAHGIGTARHADFYHRCKHTSVIAGSLAKKMDARIKSGHDNYFGRSARVAT